MLERVQERFALNGAMASIYRLPRKASYVCRITFPDGDVVDSVAERKSWLTVEGAKAWAKQVVEKRAKVRG